MLRRMSVRSVVVTAIALVAATTVFAGAVTAQQAQERLDGKLRAGSQIVVPADETVDSDLIASGGTVRVDGAITGDVVAAGGQVEVNGPVAGDVLVTGGSVRITGDVAGDVRVAAGEAELAGEVGEDVLVTAGDLWLTSASAVTGDVILLTGQARLAGSVDGSVVGGAGQYERTGVVGGDEDVRVGEAPREPTAAERALDALTRYVGLLLVGGLLVGLVPQMARGSETRLRQRPWASLGVGAGALAGGGVAVVLVLLAGALLAVVFALANIQALAAASALGGLLVAALISFGVFVVVAFLAHIVVGLWVGGLALRIGADATRWHLLGALALGLLVLALLRAVPILGGLVTLAVVLTGLGALLGWAWQRRRPAAAPPPVAPQPQPHPLP